MVETLDFVIECVVDAKVKEDLGKGFPPLQHFPEPQGRFRPRMQRAVI